MTVAVVTHTTYVVPAPEASAEDIEQALTIGDLAKMPPAVRVRYYLAACESAGLNPLTQPFTPLKNQGGQIVLYANAQAAEQLRKLHRVSVHVLARETLDTLYTVTVAVSTPDGRCDEAQGIVDVAGLKGQALANARMKCETKAKRRATLALVGLGFGAVDDAPLTLTNGVHFNPVTGEIPQVDLVRAPHGMDMPGAFPNDDARDLYGDHVSTMAPPMPPSQDASTRVDVAGLIEAIEALLTEGGTDPSRYWSALCAHWAIESPRRMAPSQLQELLAKVQGDLARKQRRTEAPVAPVGVSDEAQDADVPF